MYTGTTPLIYWYYKCTIYIYFGLTLDIELEAQWAEPMSLTFHSALRKLITDSSIGLSYQISVHLSVEKIRNQPIRNKNYLWWPCLLTDWD